MTPREQVQLIHFRFRNHSQQTDGFRMDFVSADDDTILNLTPVFKDTINALSNEVMRTIAPKHRPTLRKQIAYLIGLKQRQAEAWERFIQDCQTRKENTDQWVQLNKR